MDNIKIIKSNTEPAKQNLWLSDQALKVFTPSGWVDITDKSSDAQVSNMLYVRPAALKATPQDGLLEYNGTDLYFTKGTTRYKVSLTTV